MTHNVHVGKKETGNMEINLNVGFVGFFYVRVTNYKFTSSFVLALFLFPPPVHFIFASSKMFRAIKGWDYYFPLVGAKANSSIFTSVLLRIIPKITAKSIWTLRVTSPGVNTRKRRYGMRSLLSLSHMGGEKKKKKNLTNIITGAC